MSQMPTLDASMASALDDALRQSGPAQAIDQALRAARREWKLLLLSLCLSAGATLGYLAAVEPRYTAEAIITVSPRQSDIASTDAVVRDGMLRLPDAESELQIISSPASLSRIVEQLDLVAKAERSGGAGGGGFLERLSAAISSHLAPPALDLAAAARSEGRDGARGALIGQLGDAVQVTAIGRSTLARIRVSATDAELSAEIANAVAEDYFAGRVRGRQDAASRAAHYLRARAEELRGNVLEADRRLAALRLELQENGRDAAQIGQEMASLAEQITRARVEAERAARRHAAVLEAVRRSGPLAALDREDAIGTDRHVDRLRGAAAEAAQEAARLNVESGIANTDFRRARAQQRTAVGQLEAEARARIAVLEAESGNAAGLVAALEERLQGLRQTANILAARQVELDAVELEANTNRTVYETFLSRWRTTEQVGFNDTDGWLVSPATVPERSSWPKVPLIAAAALLAGLGLGATMVGLREFRLGRTLRSGDDVSRALGSATSRLGLIPALGSTPRCAVRAALCGRPDAAADAIASLQEALSDILPPACAGAGNVVAVTSALADEGKSAILAGIAASAPGLKVAVIDCDTRAAAQGAAFGVEGASGVAGFIRNGGDWRAAGRTDSGSGVFVVPVGNWAGRAQDFARSSALAGLVAELCAAFDLVLIDAPPVLAAQGARSVCGLADAVVLVARWGATPALTVRAARDRLASTGTPFAGVVLAEADLGRYATFDDGVAAAFVAGDETARLAAPAGQTA
ncbi:GumC family protein [Teichococcus oryzae]|uniref:Polysaccharide chain length determinant N-terminal domain-containing protein n=1 Tax=Teichococcus oryzae TaxID=1608942 RepID=A0A5B2TD99_9PROT|nr:tyrosine-protein kinase domain-containing protein [Pseudoroseomonas oryzae]KAA2212045.1 hypothetical protein F0Q34_17170 [Pseudoroseomonas oryzae]